MIKWSPGNTLLEQFDSDQSTRDQTEFQVLEANNVSLLAAILAPIFAPNTPFEKFLTEYLEKYVLSSLVFVVLTMPELMAFFTCLPFVMVEPNASIPEAGEMNFRHRLWKRR